MAPMFSGAVFTLSIPKLRAVRPKLSKKRLPSLGAAAFHLSKAGLTA